MTAVRSSPGDSAPPTGDQHPGQAADPFNASLAAGPRPGPLTDLVAQLGVGVVVGWLTVLSGAAVTIVGFARVSASDSLAEQFAYFSSGCVGGIVLIGVGACAVLSSQYADLARAARQTAAALRAGTGPNESAAEARSGRVLVLEGSSSFHTATCPFLVGRPTRTERRGDAVEAGLEACSACDP